MKTPQEAVTSAMQYLVSVVGEIEKPQNFTIESISLSKDKKVWKIVLGYERQGTEANSLSVLLGNNPRRYKTIEIDAESGEGISFETYHTPKG